MAKSGLDGFNNTDLYIEPKIVKPEINQAIEQTLARLLGWFDGGKQWRKINVDNQGRVLVSTAQKQLTTVATSQTTVGVSAVIVAANVDRRSIYIANTGSGILYIYFGATAVINQGFTVNPGQFLFNDDYLGQIAAVSSGSSTINIIEA